MINLDFVLGWGTSPAKGRREKNGILPVTVCPETARNRLLFGVNREINF